MTRWILPLGALVCLAFVCACNAGLADIGSEGSDGGTSWGEGVPAADASWSDPLPPDAAVDEDGGTTTPEDAGSGYDPYPDPDATCPPPPPPPPPCGCPVADASVPVDAEAPFPDP